MANKSIKFSDFKKRLLADPEVRKEYEALIPQFKLIREIIHFRNQANISQSQLARLTGMKQPAISRLERGDYNVTIGTLFRIADALDADLDISLKAKSHGRKVSS